MSYPLYYKRPFSESSNVILDDPSAICLKLSSTTRKLSGIRLSGPWIFARSDAFMVLWSIGTSYVLVFRPSLTYKVDITVILGARLYGTRSFAVERHDHHSPQDIVNVFKVRSPKSDIYNADLTPASDGLFNISIMDPATLPGQTLPPLVLSTHLHYPYPSSPNSDLGCRGLRNSLGHRFADSLRLSMQPDTLFLGPHLQACWHATTQ